MRKEEQSAGRPDKCVWFLRHGEGFHNTRQPGALSIQDPILTPLGEEQCGMRRGEVNKLFSVEATRSLPVSMSPTNWPDLTLTTTQGPSSSW